MLNTAWRADAGTDTGKKREINEDTYLCEPEEGFFAVIDGVGGYAGGEVAATQAREAIRRRLQNRTGTPEIRLREAVTNANNKIYWRSQEEPRLSGMACVLTVALLEGDHLFAAHVGDTRLYKIRDHCLEKLTRDHSFVGLQEDRQELSEYDAMHHPRRNEILRDVGSEHHALDDAHFIDIVEAPFEPDCALLLCSDGLTDLVPSRALLRLIYQHAGAPQATAAALIQAANDAGGTDNITVVVVEGLHFGETYPVEPVNTRQTHPPGEAEPRSLPPTEAAARPSPWRYYVYGIAIILTVLGVIYAVWKLAPKSTLLPPPQPSETVMPARLPGSINALLASAQPGDTVVVEAGDYRETVRLRSGITVQSIGPDSVRLLPPANPAPGDTVAVLAEDVTDAALIGFYIGSDTADQTFSVGILARRASVRIDQTTITGTTYAGVGIDTGAAPDAEVVLQHSTISNNDGAGVIVWGNNSGIHIADNTIRSNAKAGVVLMNEARLALRGNTILNNGDADIEIRLDTTVARLRAMNTLTGDGEDVRIIPPKNNRP